jgi:membrane-bound serine protease (ClpP class)
MKKAIISFLILVIMNSCLTAYGSDTAKTAVPVDTAQSRKVFVIPISGDVEPGMAAFVARTLREAVQSPDALIVLEMDTFGGRVDAALEIVDTMMTAPSARTVAYVKTKAISAGALIALSCGKLYMRGNTTIGDCAPLTYTDQGPQMLGEKFQSPLRAKFRALAQRNNYPEALAEAMVTEDRTVFKVTFPDTVMFLDSVSLTELSAEKKKQMVSKKTAVHKGKLLTMSAEEAVDLGFSRKTVTSIEDVLQSLGIKHYQIVTFEETWSETFARIITKIAPILMLIGFAAIYFEFKNPGLILPAVIGVICLALVFFGQYIVGLANYTELLLILLGVLLIGFEILVTPGMLILGISGVIAIGIGLVLSFQNFIIPEPSMPWEMNILMWNLVQVVGSICLATIVSFAFLRFVFPRLGLFVKGPYLTETLQSSHADSEEIKTVTVGDKGVAQTLLRPSGKALIGNLLHDVVAEGEFIEKDTAIVVIQISQNRIIVARAPENKDPDSHA